MRFNQKNTGSLIVGFGIILLIVLGLVKVDVDRKDEILCSTFHSDPNLDMSECPVHQGNGSWLMIASFGIAFLVFGMGLYLIFSHSSQLSIEFEKVDLSKFTEEERRIYEILKKNEGSSYQSDLIKETGLSKVKITRILDKMETRKILERKRRGMANLIVLR